MCSDLVTSCDHCRLFPQRCISNSPTQAIACLLGEAGILNWSLNEKQVKFFNEEGYLVLPGVFDEQEVRRMRVEADYVLEVILNSSVANNRRSGRLDWLEDDEGHQHVRKIQPINDLSLYLATVSEDNRLLQPMRDIMGEEPVLMEEKLNYKQPLKSRVEGVEIRKGIDDRFPIHHDFAYYAAQNYPQSIISSAIAIDECTVDNGPLHIWPGTHRTNMEHESCSLGLQVKEGLIDANGGSDVLVPPGSVMFFHSLLVHNSRRNSTDFPRRLMIYSHYPKSFSMCFDVRNGPTRLREAPWEHEYFRMKDHGKFEDVFHSPTYE